MLSWTFALLSIASGSIHMALGGIGAPARTEEPAEVSRANSQPLASDAPVSGAPAFLAEAREVSNWRTEAIQDLDPTPLSALAVALRVEGPVVTRCVKLNNYWCIKRARWNGEIGFDDEGHVGFDSAERGADAAVRLLRRYYLEFGRKSALDVVRRWAPAECRVAGGASGPPAVLAIRGLGNTLRARWLAGRRGRPAPIRVASAGNAVPVSARLAGEPSAGPPAPAPAATAPAARAAAKPAAPRAGAPAKPTPAAHAVVPRRGPASRVSAIPLRPLPTLKMPSIMAGLGESKAVTISATLAPSAVMRRQPTPASIAAATQAAARRAAARSAPATAPAPKPAKVASQAPAPQPAKVVPQPATTGSVAQAAAVPPRPEPAAVPPPAAPAPRPVVACAPDEQRIQNYAGRIVQGLGLQPGDDLRLFEPDGRPLPNLTRVLLAMSSFELGFLRASVELVEGAVLRATPPVLPPSEPADGGSGSPKPAL